MYDINQKQAINKQVSDALDACTGITIDANTAEEMKKLNFDLYDISFDKDASGNVRPSAYAFIPFHIHTQAEALRVFRAIHNLSQVEYGQKVGLSDVYISQIENGHRSLSRKTATLIGYFEGVSVELLMSLI